MMTSLYPVFPWEHVQVAKLLSELDIVRRNIDIMSEIMAENEPGKETADDYQLLEVSHHCHCLTQHCYRGNAGAEQVCAQHAESSGRLDRAVSR